MSQSFLDAASERYEYTFSWVSILSDMTNELVLDENERDEAPDDAYSLKNSKHICPTHVITFLKSEGARKYVGCAGWLIPCDKPDRTGILLETHDKPISVKTKYVEELKVQDLQIADDCSICLQPTRNFEVYPIACKHTVCVPCFNAMHEHNAKRFEAFEKSTLKRGVLIIDGNDESLLNYADKCPVCKSIIGSPMTQSWGEHWSMPAEILIMGALGKILERYFFHTKKGDPSMSDEAVFFDQCEKIFQTNITRFKCKFTTRQAYIQALDKEREIYVNDPPYEPFFKNLLKFLYLSTMNSDGLFIEDEMCKANKAYAHTLGY
ncbi:MAG: hypothetical protein CL608_30035 [Anaerolineaceae bacterium]|nr:hypothetical protein [Anaerolineaceae bacterium]|tara:strand:+ start:2747 stop:3712 length:966 start_codon:yes stop_codon:yes gene_type:complete